MKKVLWVTAVWVVYVGIMCGIGFGAYHEEKAQIPVQTKIEQAIEVKGLENKFVFARYMLLGGAGGGGLGAPMVICSSVQQFVDLVPEDEPIFVAFEFPVTEEEQGTHTNDYIKKVYWAFIENRAGLIVYEDEYSYDGYWVEKYTPEMIYFYYNNATGIMLTLIFGGMFGFIGAFFATGRILRRY